MSVSILSWKQALVWLDVESSCTAFWLAGSFDGLTSVVQGCALRSPQGGGCLDTELELQPGVYIVPVTGAVLWLIEGDGPLSLKRFGFTWVPVKRAGLSEVCALCARLRKELADRIPLPGSCQLASFQLSPWRGAPVVFCEKPRNRVSRVPKFMGLSEGLHGVCGSFVMRRAEQMVCNTETLQIHSLTWWR